MFLHNFMNIPYNKYSHVTDMAIFTSSSTDKTLTLISRHTDKHKKSTEFVLISFLIIGGK